MKPFDIRVIETVIVIVAYIVCFFMTKVTVNKFLKNTQLQRGRRKIMIKAFNLISLFAAILLIGAIWGLKQNQIALFTSTILTALGIAFFAQWSLLSNITSSIILFFNHPLKIGDTIEILDKDYTIEGEISDLTYFFVHLKLSNEKIITIPNSLILQKSVAVIEKTKVKTK
ncbi:mechanosensitive ion channel domain-containing protein [Flavobacterium macrobrachii]|jgi:small-conductance mechanosensitive channel|uniref:Mechanosensitive ion channel-like protein n=4 Tax=Flavobacteriaceae TaxID=49546 RepID=A0A4R6Q8M4_9FLAO|nr:mechanosensitive ion channel domain-containing protein [Flavobacterium macrobrachii]MBM6498769.1 mechanosensitive ion channel [Flavobacterium macrobrachii]PZO30685.1 MAG: mechanosensitive ion channel protein MscS [Flavobacteriaceae bacterium]TDP58196.1 mechanosensitive ion channel-like protein [Flavobacterium dankookense]